MTAERSALEKVVLHVLPFGLGPRGAGNLAQNVKSSISLLSFEVERLTPSERADLESSVERLSMLVPKQAGSLAKAGEQELTGHGELLTVLSYVVVGMYYAKYAMTLVNDASSRIAVDRACGEMRVEPLVGSRVYAQAIQLGLLPEG